MRFRIESKRFDFELDLYKDVAEPLDKRLVGLYETDPEYADMFDCHEIAEHILGVGLVTAQVYINSCIGEYSTVAETTSSKSIRLKLGPKHTSGISMIKLIMHGANFWKHCDEWDPEIPNESRNKILNTFASIGIDDEYPLYYLMEQICGQAKPLLSYLTPILEEWHNALDAVESDSPIP